MKRPVRRTSSLPAASSAAAQPGNVKSANSPTLSITTNQPIESMMRAKFHVVEVTPVEGYSNPAENLTMRPVTDKPFDSDGISEDNSFSKWTPTGELEMVITNPNLVGQIKRGESYYLDFTKAES